MNVHEINNIRKLICLSFIIQQIRLLNCNSCLCAKVQKYHSSTLNYHCMIILIVSHYMVKIKPDRLSWTIQLILSLHINMTHVLSENVYKFSLSFSPPVYIYVPPPVLDTNMTSSPGVFVVSQLAGCRGSWMDLLAVGLLGPPLGCWLSLMLITTFTDNKRVWSRLAQRPLWLLSGTI